MLDCVALIIGVGRYTTFKKIKGAGGDAKTAFNKLNALKHQDIKVDLREDETSHHNSEISDTGRNSLLAAVFKFRDRLIERKGRCWAFFYFSGHGISVEGKHYLLPSDATRPTPTSGICFEDEVLMYMRLHAKYSLTVFDACRSSGTTKQAAAASSSQLTYAAEWVHSTSEATFKGALPQAEQCNSGDRDELGGAYICWATSPYKTAKVSSGYTFTLLESLFDKGTSVLAATTGASAKVEKANSDQSPHTTGFGDINVALITPLADWKDLDLLDGTAPAPRPLPDDPVHTPAVDDATRLTVPKEKRSLDDLPDWAAKLHRSMPPALQQEPMRLLRISSLLDWESLLAYEDVPPWACLDVPYEEVSDDQWNQTAVLSWRWGDSKPSEPQRGYSPMQPLQFTELHKVLTGLRDADLLYVWIDWSCVPQYCSLPMTEIMRSKVFYMRARAMIVIPTFHQLPTNSVVRPLLVLAKEASQCARAAKVIGSILNREVVAGRDYFSRVWTLAERMARHGLAERLSNWLSLEAWLGMVVDAMLASSEDRAASRIYKTFLGSEAGDNLDRILQLLAELAQTDSISVDEGLSGRVCVLFELAVKRWEALSIVEEAPTNDWLLSYLKEAHTGMYQAGIKGDRVWAVYSYFCWTTLDQRQPSALLEAVQSLVRVADAQPGDVLKLAKMLDWDRLVPVMEVMIRLADEDTEVQRKAAQELVTMSAMNPADGVAIVEAGGIPLLLKLLAGGDKDVQTEAARALANVAGVKLTNGVAIAGAGGIPPLVKLLASTDTGVLKEAARALVNVSCENLASGVAIGEAGGIPLLVKLLTNTDALVQLTAQWALAHVTFWNSTNVQAVVEAGGIPIMVKLLAGTDAGVQHFAARTLRNLAFENPGNRAAIIKANGVRRLQALRSSSRDPRVIDAVDQALRVVTSDSPPHWWWRWFVSWFVR